MSGTWRRAPGRELLGSVRAALGDLPLIAEDLGVTTPPVERLRADFRLPGMAVTHFLLNKRRDPTAVPARSIAYSGTHDNDTSLGWWERLGDILRERALRAGASAGIAEDDPA